MALSQSMIERMRARAQAVKQEQGGGSSFPRWDIRGKHTIVLEGAHVILRVLPRWDIATKFLQQGGKFVPNPAYEEGLIYYEAAEHWYTRARDGQRLPAWCLKTFGGPEEPCPLCEASEAYAASGDDEDLQSARDIAAMPLFLYNAVVGPRGKRTLDETGKVRIGVIALWSSLYVQLVDIMTGQGEEGFACDDVSDPRIGFDLMLTRPVKDSGGRWKLSPAPKPSTLYTKDDEAAFEGWHTRLVDIPAAIAGERKTYAQLYKDVYNEEVGSGGSRAARSGNGASDPFSADSGADTVAPGASAADELDAEIAGEAAAAAAPGDVAAAGDPFGFDMPSGEAAYAAPVQQPAAAAAPAASASRTVLRKPPPPAEKRGGRQRGHR